MPTNRRSPDFSRRDRGFGFRSHEAVPGQGHGDRRWRRRADSGRERTMPVAAGEFVRSPKMARVEAALFVAGSSLSLRRLVQVAVLADQREAATLIDELNAAYDSSRSAFRIERVAAGYQLLTRPELVSWLDRIHSRKTHLKLSLPMMETLTIVAYRQPCTRADVEAIRGVQSAEIIKQLMERHLVRVVGEDDSLGRPFLYGTTRQFVETFGLRSLDDLPAADSLRQPASRLKTAAADSDESVENSELPTGSEPCPGSFAGLDQ